MSRPVLIMAGGTGGHVFPALALARLLRERSHEVVWLGTERGLEARLVPAEGIALEWLSVSGLRGKGLLPLARGAAAPDARAGAGAAVMRRHQPLVVVGLGGFVSGPGGVAAWLTRRPLVIHEQNAVAGFTNRCLALPRPRGARSLPRQLRPRRARARDRQPGAARDQRRCRRRASASRAATGPLRLLVFGGSQGAARLNAVVPLALARLAGTVRLRRAAPGRRALAATRRARATRAPACARTCGHSSTTWRTPTAGRTWSSAAPARSPSSELAAAGVGAMLVPFPGAVDDHQTHNAQYLVRAGAAVLIADRELTAERLAAELERLCASAASQAERARVLATPWRDGGRAAWRASPRPRIERLADGLRAERRGSAA